MVGQMQQNSLYFQPHSIDVHSTLYLLHKSSVMLSMKKILQAVIYGLLSFF